MKNVFPLEFPEYKTAIHLCKNHGSKYLAVTPILTCYAIILLLLASPTYKSSMEIRISGEPNGKTAFIPLVENQLKVPVRKLGCRLYKTKVKSELLPQTDLVAASYNLPLCMKLKKSYPNVLFLLDYREKPCRYTPAKILTIAGSQNVFV